MFTDYAEFLLEKILNESFLYFSPELRKKIKRIKTEIAQDLISIESTDIKDDITFIDTDTDGYVSFNTMKNVFNLLSKNHSTTLANDVRDNPSISLADQIWSHEAMDRSPHLGVYKKSRSRIKLGRLVNKLLPGKYTSSQIEDFTNRFKAELEKSGELFRIVEGDEIAEWYNMSKYKSTEGSLGNSCMRGQNGIFGIYTKNPQVCRMLILTEDDELIGRAIIWKITKKDKGEFEYFMDRQYTIKDSDVQKMRNYAIEQGWAYKTHNNHHSYVQVSHTKDGSDIPDIIKMEVQLIPISGDYDYNKYPYVDTFRRYDPQTGILYNDDREVKGTYLLDSTSGGYTDVPQGVWSEWHNEYINEEDSVYSSYLDDRIRESEAVEVNRGSRRYRGWYPEDHDSVTFDSYYEDYINTEESIYSEAYNCNILMEDASSAIHHIDSDGEPNNDEYYVYNDDDNYISISDMEGNIWYEKLSNMFKYWILGHNHYLIAKKLLTVDFEDNWIPKLYKMKAYRIVDNPFVKSKDYQGEEIPFLDEVDAKILGLELNLEHELVVDKWRYNDCIKEIYPLILEKGKIKVEDIESQIVQREGENLSQLKTDLNGISDRVSEIETKEWI